MSALVANGRIAPSPAPSDPRAAALLAHLAGVVGLTLVLTATGAFDSDEFPTWRSLTMFAIVSALLIAQSSMLARFALRRRHSRLAAALFTGCVSLAAMTAEIHLLKLAGLLPYALDPLADLAIFLAPFVLPVAGLVFAARALATRDAPPSARRRPEIRHHRGEASADPQPAILRTGEVCRVQSHDHYLLVWTPGRRIMIRGRMADALRQLADRDGISPHRSWWVARSDIACLERRGRDVRLRLRDGTRAPIARGRLQSVKQWLDGRAGPPPG